MRFRSTFFVVGLLAAGCASLPRNGQHRLSYWAFTAPWDAHSNASVRAHAGQLDAIAYGWIQLDSVTGHAVPRAFVDTLSRLAPPTTRRMAIVSNYLGTRFHGSAIRALGSVDAVALGRAAGAIARRAAAEHYQGLVLDFEGLSPGDLPANLKVVRAIADSARRLGVAPITVAIPALDTALFPAAPFFPAADYVMVMLYDQHWETSPPGPISAPDWVRRALQTRVAEVGASKIIAGLPLYGYEWHPNAAASPLAFEEAKRDASRGGIQLVRDPVTQTLTATLPGRWEIWVSDADLLRALVREVEAVGVGRVALWRLGQEDPAVWRVIGR